MDLNNPFSDSKAPSAVPSVVPSSASSAHQVSIQDSVVYSRDSTYARAPLKRRFKSYLLTGEYERPWLDDKRLKRTRMNNYIIYGFLVAGLAVSGYINYHATAEVPKHSYCLILDDTFSTLDTSVWTREVQVGGFGTGEFDWTTTDDHNAFVDDEGLHLVPTLTTNTTSITAAEIINGYTLNLTKAGGDGSCTGTTNEACSVHSNSTLRTIINPVRSARLNTNGSKSITYGRVEVVARLPAGDWLWPAIWMMPQDNVYGAWPASGEIDISESRGNDVSYPNGGRDTMSSSIHWGPSVDFDAYWLTTRGKALRRTDFSKGFHTFGLEWSEDYLYTWVDSPLQQVMYWAFPKNTNMFQRGRFTGHTANNSLVADPWSRTGKPNTPFDQPFYLILDVAVGGTNGWFVDGIGNKPWTDAGNGAADFYSGINQWYPTWSNGTGVSHGMTVKSVKMWQQGACP
ncbi:putative gram-negative bacteria binding protein [Talaromyces proteolyticus]|uniref:Gram-negative bacteria binding protein n=1 Tax=Talaromyces proteolyticus TaxID=1131652 RepID=A0AAD4PYL6_9EURO|nr:putative gram-negative bacteria binding protein [Talaromyces proteolyticus]KAH8697859.1 putative gram-negative bacteria binding protein [Talaromyces proteolyticus]